MTDLDLDALEATARAATPGPWHRHPHPLDDQMSDIRGPINDDYDVVVYAESDPSDAEHIAAFDPPTVLALIARLRTAENVVKDYDANFPCDGGCNVKDGPEETCSRHGRSPSDLWGRVEDGYRAETRLREAEAVIDAALDYAPDPTETGFETEAAMCRILSRYKTTKTENGSER